MFTGKQKKPGFTLLETVMSIFIISILVVGVLTLFNLALKMIAGNKAQVGAVTLAEEKIEIIRNLSYDYIGTIGGIPAGNIPQNETVSLNNIAYNINTQINYVDDPFDGILGVDPGELLGADYKQIRIAVSWHERPDNTKEVLAITTIAPKGIESLGGGGTLSIQVFNANGVAVPQAVVNIINNSTTPTINITSQTNNLGLLYYPGAPAATDSYFITITKNNYSTSTTCAIDASGLGCSASVGNPVPTKPHASVLENELTEISFSIDLVSTINIKTLSQFIPTEWQVNTVALNDQDSPAIAMCPTGEYLFAWRDARQTNKSLTYSQKYNQTQNNEWDPDVIVNTANNQSSPDIIVDNSCYSYVVWMDDSAGNQDIYFDKFDPNGLELWGNPVKVETQRESADQTNPRLIINASSTFEYLVWQDSRDGSQNIYSNKYDSNGLQIWANEILINSDSVNNVHYQPKLLLDINENIYYVWYDNRDSNFNIYSKKFTEDGVAIWPNDIRINTNSTTTNSINPNITISNDGYIYFVWQDGRNGNYDIYAQKYDENGVKQWLDDIKINSDTGVAVQENPVIAHDLAGNFYIVWNDNRNGSADIYMQKIDSSGNKLIDFDVRINETQTGEQENPDILINNYGYLVITWQDNSSGNFDVKAALYSEDPEIIVDVANVPLNMVGAKKIGENPIIYKYNQNVSTDSAGNLNLTNMEWDDYTITAQGGYTIISSEPAMPIKVDPNTTVNIILNVR